MNDFLASLSPALREQVKAALESDPDARARLTAAASAYIDAEGNWPTESSTAQMIASQFLHTQGMVARTYGSSGLGAVAVGGLAGGAVTLAQAKGAIVLSHWVMANYWQDTIAYAYGINPQYIRTFKKIMERVTKDTYWEQVVRDLTVPTGPSEIDLVFGEGYAQIVERELVGTMKKSAWKGARSAINHVVEGAIGNFAAENPWVEPYVRRFARSQADIANETIMGVVRRGQEQGLRPESIAQRLRDQWSLSPRYAQAVDNYRLGQMKQERNARVVADQTRRYAEKLRESRLTTMAQTEALTTFHLAREAQWIRAVNNGSMPLDTMKMWVTAKDELVCKVCRPMDGQIVSLGSTFTGEVTLMAPTAHPNCRCIIIPVTGEGVADFSRSKKLVFPVDSPVSKHLIGRHDQKKHGKKGHGRESHRSAGDWTAQTFTTADSWENVSGGDKVGLIFLGAYVGVIGGAIVLPMAPYLAKATFQTVKGLPSMPGQLYSNIKTVKQFKQLPEADKITHLASYMNSGGKITPGMKKAFPEADHLVKGIKKWTSGGQGSIRTYLVKGGMNNKQYDALGYAIASSAESGTKLFRGMDASGDVLKAYTTTGNTFKLGPTGFSSNKAVANKFAKGGFGFAGKGQPVIFTTGPKTRALRIEKEGTAGFKWEKEWLSSGTFKVTKVDKSKKVWEIEIEQTELLVPNIYKLSTKNEMARAQFDIARKIDDADALASPSLSFSNTPGTPTVNPPSQRFDLPALEKTFGTADTPWWRHPALDFTDDQIHQSGLLTHGWVDDVNDIWSKWFAQSGVGPSGVGSPLGGGVETFLALAKRLGWSDEEIAKHLGGPDGTKPHPSGTTQDVHSGKGSPDDPISEKVWDFAAFALSGGEIRDRSELNSQMRKRNQRASRPMRRMRNGKIMDFSTRQLGFMTEGYGFRLGNNNHVQTFANRMLAGEDLFTYKGRRDPVMVMVYDNGAQVLDGKHRLAAAQMAGVRKVPVQVARVHKPMPEPSNLRQEWDELRRNLVRYQYANREIPKRPDEPFDVRAPYKVEVAFNEWMQVRSAVRDEERFLEYGVTRGTKPKRFRRG